MPVGHAPLSSSFSACKSSLRIILAIFMVLIVSHFHFQNRDMGSKYHHFPNCGWCMVVWPCIAYSEYVPYPSLFVPLSHVSCRCFQRLDVGEEIYRASHLR